MQAAPDTSRKTASMSLVVMSRPETVMTAAVLRPPQCARPALQGTVLCAIQSMQVPISLPHGPIQVSSPAHKKHVRLQNGPWQLHCCCVSGRVSCQPWRAMRTAVMFGAPLPLPPGSSVASALVLCGDHAAPLQPAVRPLHAPHLNCHHAPLRCSRGHGFAEGALLARRQQRPALPHGVPYVPHPRAWPSRTSRTCVPCPANPAG